MLQNLSGNDKSEDLFCLDKINVFHHRFIKGSRYTVYMNQSPLL